MKRAAHRRPDGRRAAIFFFRFGTAMFHVKHLISIKCGRPKERPQNMEIINRIQNPGALCLRLEQAKVAILAQIQHVGALGFNVDEDEEAVAQQLHL